MKKILILILILSMLFITSVGSFTVSAKGVSPRYTNIDNINFIFKVLDPGEAHISAAYNAKADVFTYAKLTVKIQKKFLALFWKTVDIGTTDNEWISYSYDVNGQFYNYFTVNGTGTYRAVFCLEIYGTSGVVDTIEDTIEFKYN